MVGRYIFFMIFNCLRILTRAFVYISNFDANRWRADTEITQKSTSPDSILFSSMVTPRTWQLDLMFFLNVGVFYFKLHIRLVIYVIIGPLSRETEIAQLKSPSISNMCF